MGELKESFKHKLKVEGRKLKNMTLKEKVEYIWEYYKIHMLIGLMLFMCCWVVGTIIYNKSFTDVLMVAVVNDKSYSNDKISVWNQKLHDDLGYEKKDRISVEYNLTVDFSGGGSEYDYATIMKVSALIASKSLDVMIGDEKAMDEYGKKGGFEDLSKLLPEEIWENLQSEHRIYEVKDEESGAMIPVGIDLQDNVHLKEDAGISMQNTYLAVMANTPRQEASVNLIKYLLGYEYDMNVRPEKK